MVSSSTPESSSNGDEEERGIMKLMPELLHMIFDHVESDPEKCVTIDRREWLSVESFQQPPPPKEEAQNDIASLRCTCKRFSEVGVPFQFTRLSTRFSPEGFERLQGIASQPHLARAVKKFTYLVPMFYADAAEQNGSLQDFSSASLSDRARLHQLFEETDPRGRWKHLRRILMRATDQKAIIDSGTDEKSLRQAMGAFKNLQHIQLLKVQDQLDQEFMRFLRRHHDIAEHYVRLEWTQACLHASKTLVDSLLASNSPVTRFSVPQADPQSALVLRSGPQTTMSAISRNLTCLELQFFDRGNLDDKMRQLSPLFRKVFNAASKMQSVHIGFPNSEPLTLPLSEIFDNVQWDKLRAFGVDSWRLSAAEIINLARCYKRTLRGFRMRKVLLKEDGEGRWSEVLRVLRTEMQVLQWVSLRRADYEKHFDQIMTGMTAVTDDDLEDFPASDSDDEIQWEQQVALHEHDTDDEDVETESEEEERTGSSVTGSAEFEESEGSDQEVSTPAVNPFLGPVGGSVPFCTCDRSANDLGDNGLSVTRMQRKLWEQWVVGGCLIHST